MITIQSLLSFINESIRINHKSLCINSSIKCYRILKKLEQYDYILVLLIKQDVSKFILLMWFTVISPSYSKLKINKLKLFKIVLSIKKIHLYKYQNKLGLIILSTSKGLMDLEEAYTYKLGGILLMYLC